MPFADTNYYTWTFTDYTVSDQVTQPECGTPPPSCTLDWSGSTPTVTNVTIRGNSDGKILAGVTGSTGATTNIQWYLNGVLKHTGGDTYQFTGLIAGYYTVKVKQGICTIQTTNVQVVDGEFRTGTFLVQAPTTLVATENPIIMSINTARNTGNPVIGASNFVVTSTINDGDYIEITLEYPQSYTARFTAKNFPNRSDYILATTLKNGQGVTVGTNTTTEIATSLAEALSQDVVLARLYNFRASGNYVYITAKETNSKLNLNTTSVTKSGNFTLNETAIGNSSFDGEMTQGYSIYTDILVNQTAQYGSTPSINTYNRVAQLELPYQQSNVHLFDLSNVLKNFVSTPQIDFSISGASTLADMMCSYRVQYGEKYPLVPNEPTKKSRKKGETTALFCVNGAIDWTESNDMDEHLGEVFGNLNNAFTVSNSWAAYDTSTVTITNYLIDTGSTITTDIQFRIQDGNSVWRSWQSSPVFTDVSGFTNNSGNIEISGITSGITITYSGYYICGQYYTSYGNSSRIVKNNIKFLTNAPIPKQVQRDSSEYLYLILQKDYGRALSIVADLYFYDGSVLTGQTLYNITTGTTNWGGVYVVAAGYRELNLESYEVLTGNTTRKIRRVDFAIHQKVGSTEWMPLTEIRSFRYEIDEQPRRYGVAFLNKHATWDIFDFSGEIVNTIKRTNQPMEVPRKVGINGNSPIGFQANITYDTKVTKTISCNTGWIDLAHFDWLMELLSSNKIYNYTDSSQPFITVESVTYSKSSNDDLYNFDVTFVETLNQNTVSI
jgi:hypothetical protein